MESWELTLQIPHRPALTLMRGWKSMTLKRQIPLYLHLQSLSCQEKESVNVLSKMTLTFKNSFYPGHARSPKFYLGAAPWPQRCSPCPRLLFGFTRDWRTHGVLHVTESGHLLPKVFSSHWEKKSVSEVVFSSALSRLSKQAENWEEPKTTAHLKIYHKVPAVTEAANKGVETASVGSTLQPENTEQGLKTRFSSQIQHCQKVQKNYFHWLLTINLLPILLVDYFGGGEASLCSPQKIPFLLIIKEQISKTFRFF